MKGYVWLVVVLAGAALSSCGGSGSPTTPTPPPPPPPPPNISVSGSNSLRNGRSETYSANVAGCTWGTDAPQVLAINVSGTVSPVAVGSATIWCDAQGARGTKAITVIPDFQGTWVGSYTVEACDGVGVVGRLCTDLFTRGRTFPTNLNWSQDQDRVSGSFFLGSIAGSGQGPIDGEHNLVFTGRASSGVVTDDAIWRVRSDRLGRITGTLFLTVRSAADSGEARVLTNIRELVLQ